MMLEPIYFDVETNIAGRLYLVGAQSGERVTQLITHEGLRGAAEAKRLEVVSPRAALDEVLHLCQSGRPLAAFGRHDLNVLLAQTGRAPAEYIDMHRLTVRWLWRARGQQVPRPRTLEAIYTTVTGKPSPHMHAAGKTTARLDALLAALAKRGKFGSLTRVQKGKWTNVLAHNHFDVAALAEIWRRMCAENLETLQRLLNELDRAVQSTTCGRTKRRAGMPRSHVPSVVQT
jgi:hypothetical protein